MNINKPSLLQFSTRFFLSRAFLACFSLPAIAQNLDLPALSGPLADTTESHALLSSQHQQVPVNLAGYGYIEEEYLLSGQAGIYHWPESAELEALAHSPYVTRILLRRPADDRDFSGITIVEALNPSSPIDAPIMYGESWRQFIADGIAWVGVTVKPNTIKALKQFDPARYDSLTMPHAADGPVCAARDINAWSQPTTPEDETGLVWDLLSQLGMLLKSDSPDNPLSRPAEWLYMTGQSQTAGYARTYATVFALPIEAQLGEALYDGYLYSGSPPWQVPLHQCMASFDEGDPRLITGPAGVPVIEFFAQGDIGTNITSRRADTDSYPDLYRRYEVAGGAHIDPYSARSYASDADFLQAVGAAEENGSASCEPFEVEDSDFPIHYHFDAGWRTLHAWVASGTAAPRAERLQLKETAVDNFDPAESFRVDEHGNALGGIRSPHVDVPTARWVGAKNTDFSCMFYGYKLPFDKDKLSELYPGQADYVARVTQSARALQAEGWLTREGADELIARAQERDIP